eukprot:Selendium_serpulae@DN5511_c1_g2_i3.p1
MRFPEAEALFATAASATSVAAGDVRVFNPIQTQVFSTLYNTNDNVLLCAPPGSGKVVCAEFAIIRLIRNETNPESRKCVYIAPYERIAKQRLAEWSAKFASPTTGLGLKVNELCGDMQTDLKTISRAEAEVEKVMMKE